MLCHVTIGSKGLAQAQGFYESLPGVPGIRAHYHPNYYGASGPA